jgi:hypothetical protein
VLNRFVICFFNHQIVNNGIIVSPIGTGPKDPGWQQSNSQQLLISVSCLSVPTD